MLDRQKHSGGRGKSILRNPIVMATFRLFRLCLKVLNNCFIHSLIVSCSPCHSAPILSTFESTFEQSWIDISLGQENSDKRTEEEVLSLRHISVDRQLRKREKRNITKR